MPPRFLADEMVGRLARYLRIVGCDTVYARGLEDDEIVRAAERDARVVLTRDRALARRAPHALLLTSPSIADQWRAVVRAFPDVPTEPTFARCTVCNGTLRYADPGESPGGDGRVPWDRVRQGLPLYRCEDCGHLYWEGSHTRHVRDQIGRWRAERGP